MVLRCDLFGFMISYVPAADYDETTLQSTKNAVYT